MRQGVSVTIMFDVEGVETLEQAISMVAVDPRRKLGLLLIEEDNDWCKGVKDVRYEGYPYTIRELNESCGPV